MFIPIYSKLGPAASVLVSIAVLFSSCGRSGDELPSKVSKFPADLTNPKMAVAGIYPDGWIGAQGSLNLNQPNGDRWLSIRGEVPQIGDKSFHTGVVVRMDNLEVARRELAVGSFQISVPVSDITGKRSVSMEFSALQQLPGGDDRNVGARLLSMSFEATAAPTAADSSDIVRGSGLQLGTGWGAIETYKSDTFRWVENDAQLLLTAAKPGDVAISLLVEPGPGVGARFLLKMLDASGKLVASVPVEKRGSVKLVVPVAAGTPNEFRLHVDGGGKKDANDPRILNFRVFQIEASPWH